MIVCIYGMCVGIDIFIVKGCLGDGVQLGGRWDYLW
jgi:hypothetical protein